MTEKDPNLKPKLYTGLAITLILTGLLVGGYLLNTQFVELVKPILGGIFG